MSFKKIGGKKKREKRKAKKKSPASSQVGVSNSLADPISGIYLSLSIHASD